MDKSIRIVRQDAPEDYSAILALSVAERFALLEELNRQVYYFATQQEIGKMDRQIVRAIMP